MDTTFNEEIVIEFNSKEQTASVTAQKTFADLAIHIGSSGIFKTESKTCNPGKGNFYNKNTVNLSGVFSDYMLYKKILEFLNLRELKIYNEDSMQDIDEKKTRISIILANCDIKK